MLSLALILTTAFLVLAAGCIVADQLFPRLRLVERFIRDLPLGRAEKGAKK